MEGNQQGLELNCPNLSYPTVEYYTYIVLLLCPFVLLANIVFLSITIFMKFKGVSTSATSEGGGGGGGDTGYPQGGTDMDEGPIYNPNARSNARPPAAGPSPWEVCQNDDGETYYYNVKTNESVWDPPPDL